VGAVELFTALELEWAAVPVEWAGVLLELCFSEGTGDTMTVDTAVGWGE